MATRDRPRKSETSRGSTARPCRAAGGGRRGQEEKDVEGEGKGTQCTLMSVLISSSLPSPLLHPSSLHPRPSFLVSGPANLFPSFIFLDGSLFLFIIPSLSSSLSPSHFLSLSLSFTQSFLLPPILLPHPPQDPRCRVPGLNHCTFMHLQASGEKKNCFLSHVVLCALS